MQSKVGQSFSFIAFSPLELLRGYGRVDLRIAISQSARVRIGGRVKSAASRRVIDWRYPEFDHRCYRFAVTDISVVSFLACEIVSAACANGSDGRSDLIRPDESVPSSSRSLSRYCCRRQASISSNKILHGRARESSKVVRLVIALEVQGISHNGVPL